ncbi:LOW QUALITY PROTEIN: hypothetical protein BC936DRAFT_149718 [Jimgerdemannia flammicorona]|uniref:DNA 5'-3' helicase n=1 Tax=Jimgerdemannia flammicorona TaxID=994334 RepID=A0A433D087_9FUNG|nr:LOW QUALITY PROTEIN: hypothetical protein BC936DRAFT_149718 [Jimgerdemannia flammicorona]
MPHYTIRGITVNFPYEAYGIQKIFMEKVIHSLQSKQNGLLESPTGTGKTLTLLCAVLAWREAWQARRQLDRGIYNQDVAELDAAISTSPSLEDFIGIDAPKIIYASRTHSQLAQTVSELKNTAYKPKICVLGSREHLCIHPEVKVASNSSQAALCRQKVSKKACEFHKRVNDVKAEPKFENEIMDIEDIVKFGFQHQACPYYLTRENQQRADIIFLPYNYLIDANARKSQNIDLKNCIIIFDEAHNLESSCGEATSFEITPTDLANSIREAQICRDYALKPGYFGEYDENAFEILKALLVALEAEIDKLEIPSSTQELIKPGDFMYELLNRIKINSDTFEHLQRVMDTAVNMLATIESDEGKRPHKYALNHILSALKTVFRTDFFPHGDQAHTHTKYYKVHIKNEELAPNANVWAANRGKTVGRKISYWCFSPGLAMKDLVDQGVRSIILASGTLAPLDSFASEFHIDFELRLENPHIIDANQALIAVVPKGPSGHTFNSSYETRKTADYKSDLGNAIVNFSRIIPDGLLVFFPSYSVMADCIAAWKQPMGPSKSIWDRINHHKKAFIEPKNKQELGQTMDDFYKKVADANTTGAVFFAVCRGKVSEGVDFADSRGRAVVVTGIPYASSYLEEEVLGRCASERSFCDHRRVIRHRKDYGAILLCDERFASPAIISQLSGWVRPFVKVCNNFGEAQGQVTKFFKSIESVKESSLGEHNKKSSASNMNVGNHHALHTDGNLRPSTEQLIRNPSKRSELDSDCVNDHQGRKLVDTRSITVTMKYLTLRIGVGNGTDENILIEHETTMSSSSEDASFRRSKKVSLLDTLNFSKACHITRFQAMTIKGIPLSSVKFKRKTLTLSFHKTTTGQNQTKGRNKTSSVSGLSKTSKVIGPVTDGQPADITASVEMSKNHAQKYKEQLKFLVGSDGYLHFQQLLRDYSSMASTINQLIDGLIQLFEEHQQLELLKGFEFFIPPKHRELFRGIVNELGKPRTRDAIQTH